MTIETVAKELMNACSDSNIISRILVTILRDQETTLQHTIDTYGAGADEVRTLEAIREVIAYNTVAPAEGD